MPGIDGAANFIGKEVRKVGQDAKTGLQNIAADTKAAAAKSAFDVPGAMAVSVAKNGVTFGAKLMMKPIEWTMKTGLALGKAGINTGLQLASLIPIPMPGGNVSVAQMRGSVADLRSAIGVGAAGDARPLSVIMDELRARRTGTPVTPPANPTQTA
jgi:hypothetical protein